MIKEELIARVNELCRGSAKLSEEFAADKELLYLAGLIAGAAFIFNEVATALEEI